MTIRRVRERWHLPHLPHLPLADRRRRFSPADLPALARVLFDNWHVDVLLSVQSPGDEVLWNAYQASFQPLEDLAAQRHLMSRGEFGDHLVDPRIDKIVVSPRGDHGSIAALSMMTNDLDAVGLVSPGYYRRRWPDLYEQQRIWYVLFVGVTPPFQGSSVMGAVIAHQVEVTGQEGGILALDISDENEREHNLSAAILRIGSKFSPGARRRRLDSQTYWAYEIPRHAQA